MAYREAYQRMKRLYGPKSTQVSEGARNIALLLKMQGKFQESLAAFDEAIGIARGIGKFGPVLALMEAQRAVVLNRLGRRKEALAILRSAVGRLRDLSAERLPALARIDRAIVSYLRAMGVSLRARFHGLSFALSSSPARGWT